MTSTLRIADVAPLAGLEARIRSDAARYEDDRAKTVRWMAESVIDGPPCLASTHLTMLRPLCDEGLSDDDVAQLFAEVVELVRTAQIVDSKPNGDSTMANWAVDGRIDLLIGRDTHIQCVWCDRREDREIAESCDGLEYCSTECHLSSHSGACPEGDF